MEVNNLKSYLSNIGMSIMDFSASIGCNNCYLSSVIHGRAYPSPRLAKDIAEATDGVIQLATRPRKPSKNHAKD